MIWNLCIRRPVLTVVIFLVIAIFGIYGYSQLPVREFPDIEFPVVNVSVVLRGADPEVSETEVVPDIGVQRACRNAGRVRLSVGLDLVRVVGDELGSLLEIRDGLVEAPQRDPAVATMPEQTCVLGPPLDSPGEDLDRLAIPPQVGSAAPEPDQGGGIVGCLYVSLPRALEIRLERRTPLRRQLGCVEGDAEQGRGLWRVLSRRRRSHEPDCEDEVRKHPAADPT